MLRLSRPIIWLFVALLAACATPEQKPVVPVTPPVTPPVVTVQPYSVATWDALPQWHEVDLLPSWRALQQSCAALRNKPSWQTLCADVAAVTETDVIALRGFFESHFSPYQINNADGTTQGLVTGYYEPRLRGSRTRTEKFRYPLYAVPDDLLTIDLSSLYPQLKDLRLRGRIQGKKVVPYFSRGEIEAGAAPLQDKVLFWVDDAIDLFFLQIQGSGRIELPDGSLSKVGYADQNGHSYISIGKKLIEAGELKPEEASMQGIKSWGLRNPEKLPALLAQNPSYVFFRNLPATLSAPLGALGVPLTEGYSIAVDPRTIPLGMPVFLATTQPNSSEPLNRLMLAQDTGGAIKGTVRADFFWGFGEQAGEMAGRMKQRGEMWILFPKGMEPSQPH
ncbi:MAG: MltA domain-containing protein [Gallionella sp.]|nr:MltA domain-containing protein [Gallionella sp.]